MTKQITVYTDGSCVGNPGKGGWAAFFIETHNDLNDYSFACGNDEFTTNNKMELMGAIRALEILGDSYDILNIYVDSQYVRKGITEWIHKWKNNNWLTANKDNVKNQDLWQRLDHINNEQVKWNWVQAHAQNQYNNVVDRIANDAARFTRSNMRTTLSHEYRQLYLS